MTEDIEVFFPVRISVAGVVGADYLVLEDLLSSFIEALGRCKKQLFLQHFLEVFISADSGIPAYRNVGSISSSGQHLDMARILRVHLCSNLAAHIRYSGPQILERP